MTCALYGWVCLTQELKHEVSTNKSLANDLEQLWNSSINFYHPAEGA